MDVSDAFSKLREQILVYDNPESELERSGGLNLVNTTNLSFFDASQKSELFRLKAVFLASLSARSKANQAYCHSVQICPSYARSWISWGGLCSSLGDITEKQREHQATTGTESGAVSRFQCNNSFISKSEPQLFVLSLASPECGSSCQKSCAVLGTGNGLLY